MMTRGGGGGLLPFVDDFERADGDLGNGWEYAPGVWTISGGEVVATPSLGPDLLTNGNMEDGDPPHNWTPGTGATLASAADERTGGAGAKSMEITRGSSNAVATQTPTIAANAWLRMGGWFKKGTGTNVGMYSNRFSFNTTSPDWVNLVGAERAIAANIAAKISLTGSAGQTGRADDITEQVITFPDTLAVVNAGTPYVRASATITVSQYTPAGVILALDSQTDPKNFIAAFHNQTYLLVQVCKNGTYSEIVGTTSYTSTGAPTNNTLELEYQSNGILRIYWDGHQWGEDKYVDPASFAPGNLAGMLSTDPTNLIHAASVRPAAAPIALNGDENGLFAVITAASDLWSLSGEDSWLGRPVLVDDGTKWIAVYRSGTSHTASGKFHIRFSDSKGAAWSDEDKQIGGAAVTGAPFLPHAPNTNCSDAILILAPNGDLLLHVDEATGCYQYRSEDGGAAWSDEGLINGTATAGSQDYTIAGSDIYVPMHEGGWMQGAIKCYKSSDNGAGAVWTAVGTIEQNAALADEVGIHWLGGTTLLAIMRDTANAATYKSVSTDLGVTWGARTLIPDMGVLQRARMKALAGGILLYGRDQLALSDYTVVWYSLDGVNWSRKFYPDTTYASDCGYCDVLPKDDGSFYMLTYAGSILAAKVRSAVFGIA